MRLGRSRRLTLSREAKRSGASGAGRETASDEFGIVLCEGLPAAQDPVAIDRIEFAYPRPSTRLMSSDEG